MKGVIYHEVLGYNWGLWLIVLVISCFLARLRGQPENGKKGRTYMRKRFEAVREREREREA